MPGLDRTGPEGQGSRTGRQMGKCAPRKKASGEATDQTDTSKENIQEEDFNNVVGSRLGRFQGRGPGRGAGRGPGRGAGRGRNRGGW